MKIFFAPSLEAADKFLKSHSSRDAQIITDMHYTWSGRYQNDAYDIDNPKMYHKYDGEKCGTLLVYNHNGLSLEQFLSVVCQCANRSGIARDADPALTDKYEAAVLTAGKPFEVMRTNLAEPDEYWQSGIDTVKALIMHFKTLTVDEETNKIIVFRGTGPDDEFCVSAVDITPDVRLTREWIETDAPEKHRLASEFDSYMEMAKDSLESSLALRKNGVSLYLTSAPAIGGHMVSYIREKYPDMFPDKNNIVMLYNSDTTALSICCIDHPDYRNPYGDEVKEGDELPELGFKFFEHSPEAISFSETGSSSVLGGVSPIDVRQIFNFLAAGYRYGVPGSEIDTNDRDSMSLPKHADFKFLVRDAAMWESPTDFDLS